MTTDAAGNIHATALVLDGTGLILRGPSGSGKSLLALALLDRWQARGRPAALVSDDRVDIEPHPGGLLLRAPPSIAGLIELRGRGIVARPHLAEAPLHLVIDLVDTLERMVEETELVTELCGVRLARAPVPRAGIVELEHRLMLVDAAIVALKPDTDPARQNIT